MIVLLLGLTLPSAGQVLITRKDVHHDVSPALRDLAKTAPAPPADAAHEAEEIRSIPLPSGFKPATEPDPVLQRTTVQAPALAAPTIIKNFDGLGTGVPPTFQPRFAPPDTNGAVGLTQYVQWVNVSFAVFDKATTNITLGPLNGNTIWSGFGGSCEANNDGDPIIIYDKLADRWVFTQFVVRNPTPPPAFGPFLQCVAVSTTPDATGTYNRYAFTYSNFDDYPKMGVWPDAYYVTFNMFNPTGTAFVGADACAYDRNAMLNGQPATQICFQQGPSVGGLLPSDVDGHVAPPAGSPNFLMYFGSNNLNLFKFHVDFATPANSTFTGPTVIPVAPFTPLCGGGRGCVPQQPGDGTQLDSLADRLMHRLAYRNFGDHESLVVNHSVAVNLSGGVRWYEIQNPNGTPAVAQQSTFAPDASFRWMGSIAMDVSGDIALGYSVSSSTMFPAIAFAARSFSDPASTLGAETTIVAGTGSQTGGLTRWGDYSAMQVDPSDDCTFWYTTEYEKAGGSFNWNTRIASFKFPGCGIPQLSISKTHTGNFTQGQTGATYTLTVSNTGGKATDGTTVTATDTLPTGLTATAIAGTNWTCTLNTLVCTRSDVLAAGGSYEPITLTVNVNANAPGLVTNTATATGGGDSNLSSASDPTTVIQTGPDLAITKTHSGLFIQGQSGTYTITVSNAGLSDTDGTLVTVTDSLPAGLTAATATGTGWSCTIAASVTCTRTDVLTHGTSYPPITLTVNIANNLPLSLTLINSAQVSGGGDTNALNNGASDPTTILPPPPDLTITKSHTGDFSQGQTSATYTLTVKNAGIAPSNGTVTVTDTLPTGLTAAGMFGTGWSCGLLTCTRSDVLAGGASYPAITVFVNVASNAPATVTNTATVSGGGDVSPGNDTATDLTTVNPSPDLTIALSHTPDPFSVGQAGTYTITVSNTGNGPTTGTVSVTDFLPFAFTATAASGTGWNCQIVPSVTCTRADALAASSSYPLITITVNVSGGGPSVTNSATVSGGGEFNTSNDFASDLTNVIAPTLAISMTHTGNFTAGQPGTYTITVSNTGPIASAGVVTVSDFLPGGFTAIAMTGAGWTCSTPPTTFVNCTRSDSLAVSSGYPPIALTVSVGNSLSNVTNTANVNGGGDSQSHSASDPTIINVPVLAITKTHTGNFTVGQPGTYTITVSNKGTTSTVGAVTVTDFLPFGLSATAVSGAGWSCGTLPTTFLTCTRADALHDGQSYPALSVTVSVTGTGNNTVTNIASVTGGGDGLSHNASDLTNILAPSLTITKSHSGNFTVGQPGAYTITVGNTGTGATSGTVTVNDFLPSGMSATAFSGTGWNCSGTSFVSCTRSDALAPAGSYPSITLTVSVNGGGASTVNSANVSGGGDGNFHSASDPTTVIGPTLAISKSHTGSFTVGQTGNYTIKVSNVGTIASVGTVNVSDFLPQGLTATAISGTGWSCSTPPTNFVNCTRSDSLAPAGSYPTLTLTVSVGGTLPSVVNTAGLNGGGDPNFHSASDTTLINTPTLAITKSHSPDPFIVGQTGTYTLTVSNAAAATAATTGTVTVTDSLPSGLTATAVAGTGWNCSGVTFVQCSRSDSLPINSSYPPVAVTVSVGNTGATIFNTANVSGGGDGNSHSANDTANVSGTTLAITKSHTGNFTVGQSGTYSITVSNVGFLPTVGTVTVTDFLPPGMSLAGVTGTGWLCSGFNFVTCTRSDSLAPAGSYPAISLTVSVIGGGPTVTNSASVTGGGDALNHSASDPTTIISPTLGITESHTGNFTVGQIGTYTITVSNTGTIATAGAVNFSDFLPFGLTASAANASGWNCSFLPTTFLNCSRSDVLAGGASYPPITLFVSLDPNIQPLVNNTVSVSGGGDVNSHSTNDPTIINLPDLAITASHSGDFTAGQAGAFTLTVSNAGTVATAGGTVTVDDFLPGGLTASSASGTDWNCSLLTGPPAQVNCTRPAGVLNQNGSYPPITLNVAVAPDAASPLTNVADVFGIGESNFANNSALDSTVIAGFRFVPVTPCRIADTRNANGPFGGPFLSGNTTRGFTIPNSACSIPATAQAYSLNVTVVPKGTLGFLTMFPCGQPLPLASTLNSVDGRVKAGAAIIPAGTGGAVCAFPTNDTELVLDINGYFVPASDPASLAFYPVAPCRLVDTRLANGPLGGPALVGAATRSFPILSSSCNIPATAKAYSLNYTSVPNGALGFLTTWPAGQTQPLVSTLNATTGTVTANAAIVPAGTNGDISVFVTNNSNLIIDIDGYFAPPGPGGLSLFPLTPCRVLDTRNPQGTPPFSGSLDQNAVAAGCAVPPSAQAFVLNATVVPSSSLGFLTLWPQGAAQPLVSTLNALDSAITSNLAIVPTTNGSVSAFVSNPTHLILDISAFFAP
ncbi:MAG: DUF11 domain-containing protein [Acidobacteriia bacterium]|nr:DUF11 domain-containing protein [Terriglobia bacterium]